MTYLLAAQGERPFHVVTFTGYPIHGSHPRAVTDFHVVDARGRTVKVWPYTMTTNPLVRRQRAERYARKLTGCIGGMFKRRGRQRWSCVLCGTGVKGPRRAR